MHLKRTHTGGAESVEKHQGIVDTEPPGLFRLQASLAEIRRYFHPATDRNVAERRQFKNISVRDGVNINPLLKFLRSGDI